MPNLQDVERIDEALKVLGEHFDSVQIFATRHEPTEGGTIHISKGLGNIFTRHGHIRAWLTKEEEGARIEMQQNGQ